MVKILQLTWKKAHSYRIVKPSVKMSRRYPELMGSVSYLVPEGPVSEYQVNDFSGAQRRRRASMMLANLPAGSDRDNEKAAKDWADQWGLLTSADAAPVADFYDAAGKLWGQCFAEVTGYAEWCALPLEHQPSISIKEGITKQGVFARTPGSLFDYCWLEIGDLLADMRGRGAQLRHCDYCGGVYVPKPRAGENRFCNHNAERCKNAFRNEGNVAPNRGADPLQSGEREGPRDLDQLLASYGRKRCSPECA